MSNAPALDLSAIPIALRAAVLALLEEVAALKDITKRQEHLIAELNHALHGKRSEKLTEGKPLLRHWSERQWRPAAGLRGPVHRAGRGRGGKRKTGHKDK
jgi:hypothetical protein